MRDVRPQFSDAEYDALKKDADSLRISIYSHTSNKRYVDSLARNVIWADAALVRRRGVLWYAPHFEIFHGQCSKCVVNYPYIEQRRNLYV